jgi:large subunit ribosomal protein L15e
MYFDSPSGGNTLYRHLKEAWKTPKNSFVKEVMMERVIIWRKEPASIRIDRPTRLDRARSLGYKAKNGIIVVRTRIRRGGRNKLRPILGRRQKRMGVKKYTAAKSKQLIAEERTARKYPNMEVLNSYWVWQDGRYKWYEVILVDPNNPAIKSDKDLSWIAN